MLSEHALPRPFVQQYPGSPLLPPVVPSLGGGQPGLPVTACRDGGVAGMLWTRAGWAGWVSGAGRASCYASSGSRGRLRLSLDSVGIMKPDLCYRQRRASQELLPGESSAVLVTEAIQICRN
jgi:hypothetical protein